MARSIESRSGGKRDELLQFATHNHQCEITARVREADADAAQRFFAAQR